MGKEQLSHERLQWLDELRGIAALSILLAHYRLFLSDVSLDFNLLDVAPRGVQLFYVLSGYILYTIYRNRLIGWESVWSFYVKRWFRIAPLFYSISILSVLLFFSEITDPGINLLLHLLILPFGMYPDYINGIIGPEWSIYVEFWFYMAFPLLLWLFSRWSTTLFIAALLLSFSQTVYFYFFEPDIGIRTFWYNQPTAQLVFFVAGMLAVKLREVLASQWLVFIGWSGVVLIVLLGFSVKYFSVQLFFSLPLLTMLVIGYADISKPGWLSRGLSYVGKISFSLYLFHMPVRRVAEIWLDLQGVKGWMMCMIATFVLSMITYRYIERPGIEYGRKLIHQRELDRDRQNNGIL